MWGPKDSFWMIWPTCLRSCARLTTRLSHSHGSSLSHITTSCLTLSRGQTRSKIKHGSKLRTCWLVASNSWSRICFPAKKHREPLKLSTMAQSGSCCWSSRTTLTSYAISTSTSWTVCRITASSSGTWSLRQCLAIFKLQILWLRTCASISIVRWKNLAFCLISKRTCRSRVWKMTSIITSEPKRVQ